MSRTLRPYQEEGVRFILENAKGRAYIGDEMGLGKSATAIEAIVRSDSFPCLILCPSVMSYAWAREIQEWHPDHPVDVVSMKKSRLSGAPWAVCSYALSSVIPAGGLYRSLIIDEAHYLKNASSQRSKVALSLARRAEKVILLSGTPVLNRPEELVSQIDLLGRLGEFGGKWRFLWRYCSPYKSRFGWDFSGAANLPELGEKLRASFYLRRTKAQVLSELPEHTREAVPVAIERQSLMQYRKEVSRPKGHLSRGHLSVALEVLGHAKVSPALGWIEEWAAQETSGKLVVFARHHRPQRELLEGVEKMGLPSARILAEDHPSKREEAVRRFQTDPECRVIVVSLLAGGVGITLTAADRALFVEQDWVPATLMQAEARISRMGQKARTTATYLFCRNTLDEVMFKVLQRKSRISGEIHQEITGEVLDEMARLA